MGYLDDFEVCAKEEISIHRRKSKYPTAELVDEFIESGNEIMVKDYDDIESAQKVYGAFKYYLSYTASGRERPVDVARRGSRIFLIRR